jgi:hypothetical protein
MVEALFRELQSYLTMHSLSIAFKLRLSGSCAASEDGFAGGLSERPLSEDRCETGSDVEIGS